MNMYSENLFQARANIKVVGVGGAGCNAINRMIMERVSGVSFVAMNTDAQVLATSRASTRIQLGESLTHGLGSGGNPEVGELSARESAKEIERLISGADMVFVAAGMGGGTGTGAAPVVAEIAKSKGILTVGVVTKPFRFEGPRRREHAERGAEKLKASVDTLISVPNDRLLDVVERRSTLDQAFSAADDILRQGVQGISEIILVPGLINVDFADVRSVMKNAGAALMGLGTARGESRAKRAAEAAAASKLLETSIEGARRLLVNISSGSDFTLTEATDVMEYLVQFTEPDEAEIIMGHVLREEMGDEVRVTILAAGMGPEPIQPFTKQMPAAMAPEVPEEEFAIPSFMQAIETEDEDMAVSSATNLDIPTFLRRQREHG